MIANSVRSVASRFALAAVFSCGTVAVADEPEAVLGTIPAAQTGPVAFEKLVLTDEYLSDGVAVTDIDRDGHPDIVSGPYWYPGPEFQRRVAFYPPVPLVPQRSPSDSMFTFADDFTGNGWPDLLVLGRVHKHAAYWYENPGGDLEGDATANLRDHGHWDRHLVFERIRGESPTLVDLLDDGIPRLICHWEGRWGWVAPDPRRPRLPWRFRPIGEVTDPPQFYHGQGVGDLNGDGRLDVILNDGWYRQPDEDPADRLWDFHPYRFSKGRGGAQMFADDLTGDGLADVITAIDAHGWGLAWFRQKRHGSEVAFDEVTVMSDRSEKERYGAAFTQPHALAFADIDGDGLRDIVTGKRRWAHGPDGDIEPGAPPVVYWFRQQRDESGMPRFVPHRIDDGSGVGVQIRATDVNHDGRVDVVTTSKLGTFLFRNLGPRDDRP